MFIVRFIFNKHKKILMIICYLGIFTNGTMPMEYTRNKKFLETPSLELMTETAIKVISKNENGFFLMVCIIPKINKNYNPANYPNKY